MLQPLQQKFQPANYPDLLVGLDAPDDATVYRINEHQAIVQTVDFFSPVVDDPYYFGAIAAANSISDIYAMGGDPIFALNILAVPDDLPTAIISEILRGGADKAAEAGIPIAGGHTVRDKEPKYGLTVTGLINPAAIMPKGGARAGDALILTKPLGVGVITTALKRDQAHAEHVAAAILSMATLNKTAAAAARRAGVRAATDITGFGLLGHALEMANQSGVKFTFSWPDLPWLDGALEYAHAWIFPGGASTNQAAAAGHVSFDDGLEDWQRLLLHDPETSGGLLLAIAHDKADALLSDLHTHNQPAWRIGFVLEGSGIRVNA